MKKGYIVTTSFANNYGALLQAYALRRFIEKETGKNVSVIDYWPKDSQKVWDVFYDVDSIRTLVRNLMVFIDVGYRRSMNNRKKLMFQFRDKYLSLTSKEYYNEKDLISDRDLFKHSFFVCGSDQIWNTAAYWKDPVYFLNFVSEIEDSKAIAYAPSITDLWEEKDFEEIKSYLNKIQFLSVREKADIDQVHNLVPERSCVQVIDPVFLLEKEEWDSLVDDVPILKDDYILCYFLGAGDLAKSLVEKLRELTGYKVVYLNINYSNFIKADLCIKEASPKNFISLIKNSKIVVSNSFHCSAFSVIYQKDYFVVPKDHANSRMESLQQMAGINNRIINKDFVRSLTLDKIGVDYSNSKVALKEMISRSKSYLLDSIND